MRRASARSQETEEIRALLVARVEQLARELAPEGRRSGGYWMAKNPTRADRRGGSFWVRLDSGAWKDEATGETGDVFRLIGYVHGLVRFPEVMAWSRGWLGLGDMPAVERRARAMQASARQRMAETERRQALEKAQRAAKALYLASRKRPIAGSPVDAYLRGRGIDLSTLSRVPGCLGWLPDGWHREESDDPRAPRLTQWPTMVAAFTADDGQVVAVHRTWIARDGSGKAGVDPPRKIWPAFGGAAIRLWRGASGLSVADAEAQGLLETLLLCEGVEDGLSLAVSSPEHRIWCAGSLGNLSALKLPRCVDRVVVCADNDWGKRQAAQQLDKALAALARQGAEVRVARSHIGKDVNDCLRGVS